MKGHFASVQDAQAIVDDFLDRWQVLVGLENDPGDLKFKYENTEYERVQKDGKSHIDISANVGEIVVVSENVQLHVSRNQLPNRPHKFKLSPDVMTMYERYKLFRQGKESLTSMAYMCLTILEANARASTHYNKSNNLTEAWDLNGRLFVREQLMEIIRINADSTALSILQTCLRMVKYFRAGLPREGGETLVNIMTE